jgi:hypothetical protein
MNFIIGKYPKNTFHQRKNTRKKKGVFLNQREQDDCFSPQSQLKITKGKGKKIVGIRKLLFYKVS